MNWMQKRTVLVDGMKMKDAVEKNRTKDNTKGTTEKNSYFVRIIIFGKLACLSNCYNTKHSLEFFFSDNNSTFHLLNAYHVLVTLFLTVCVGGIQRCTVN